MKKNQRGGRNDDSSYCFDPFGQLHSFSTLVGFIFFQFSYKIPLILPSIVLQSHNVIVLCDVNQKTLQKHLNIQVIVMSWTVTEGVWTGVHLCRQCRWTLKYLQCFRSSGFGCFKVYLDPILTLKLPLLFLQNSIACKDEFTKPIRFNRWCCIHVSFIWCGCYNKTWCIRFFLL